MSKITKQIREDFDTIKNIVLTITLLLGDIKHFKIGIDKERIIISEYRFLWRIYNSLYINMILDFHKLFNGNENFSFKKLFNKLENNFKNIDWSEKPDKTLITNLRNDLVSKRYSDVFEKVKLARDQYYAHLDCNRPPSIQIPLDDIETLLKFAQEIVVQIRIALDSTHQSFIFGETDIGHYLISDLYKFNLIRHTIYRDIENDAESLMKKIFDIL